MIIKDYYDFIVLIAFRTLLVYEGKRKIKVTVLNDYIKEAIKLALKKYEERKEICYVDGWNGKVEFEDYDPIGSLKEFLLNYSDLFMLDGDSVKLTDSISEEEFEGLYSQISINRKDLERLTSQTDKSLLQILGISKFENILKKYRNSEELLEQCYLKINTAEDTSEMREQLEKLLKVRLSFLLNIMMLSVKRKEAICLLSGTFEEVDYDVPPISNLDWENRDNYNEEYGLCDIEDRIYDLFQYAYFGKKTKKSLDLS